MFVVSTPLPPPEKVEALVEMELHCLPGLGEVMVEKKKICFPRAGKGMVEKKHASPPPELEEALMKVKPSFFCC